MVSLHPEWGLSILGGSKEVRSKRMVSIQTFFCLASLNYETPDHFSNLQQSKYNCRIVFLSREAQTSHFLEFIEPSLRTGS
jgi:hypothetical protein